MFPEAVPLLFYLYIIFEMCLSVLWFILMVSPYEWKIPTEDLCFSFNVFILCWGFWRTLQIFLVSFVFLRNHHVMTCSVAITAKNRYKWMHLSYFLFKLVCAVQSCFYLLAVDPIFGAFFCQLVSSAFNKASLKLLPVPLCW